MKSRLSLFLVIIGCCCLAMMSSAKSGLPWMRLADPGDDDEAAAAAATADDESVKDRLEPDEDMLDDTHLRFSATTDTEQLWQTFKADHGKNYADSKEETKRKQIFEKNLKTIDIHNRLYSKGLKTFTLGINEFADLDLAEFLQLMTCTPDGNSSEELDIETEEFLSKDEDFTAPASADWRTKGYVTPIKNQRHCGSCWSFSATGALEGQHFRKTGRLVSLSEQNLVDCSTGYGNYGCRGGLSIRAFRYIIENGGIDTEESYPYEAKDGPCRYDAKKRGASCSAMKRVKPGSEKALLNAVATVGPIAVSIDAKHRSFHLYKRGVYYEPECSSTKLSHAVLAVGYGSTSDGDYWIVKNSWGATWGNDGYILMARGRENNCGIATRPVYPVI